MRTGRTGIKDYETKCFKVYNAKQEQTIHSLQRAQRRRNFHPI
jgi:hypothetical protein